jgi:hypothetical protein
MRRRISLQGKTAHVGGNLMVVLFGKTYEPLNQPEGLKGARRVRGFVQEDSFYIENIV